MKKTVQKEDRNPRSHADAASTILLLRKEWGFLAVAPARIIIFARPAMECVRKAMLLLGKELECTVCLSTLVYPVSLPCSHLLCHECVAHLLSSPMCPLCKNAFTRRNMVPDDTIREICDAYSDTYQFMSAELHLPCQSPTSSQARRSVTHFVVTNDDIFSLDEDDVPTQGVPPLLSTHEQDSIHFEDVGEASPSYPLSKNSLVSPINMSDHSISPNVSESSEQSGIATFSPAECTSNVDSRCSVCFCDEWNESNQIVVCESCNVAVHQDCYGIESIPVGDWLCEPCIEMQSPTCCACVNHDDIAFKKTNEGEWIHMLCALWHPETNFSGVSGLNSPVVGFKDINRSRFKVTCRICKVKQGAIMQCNVPQCTFAFHPPCGIRNGCKFEIREENDVSHLHQFCPKHCSSSKDYTFNYPKSKKRRLSANSSPGHKQKKKTSTSHREEKILGKPQSYLHCEIVLLTTKIERIHSPAITQFCSIFGARVVTSFSDSVTHVLTPARLNDKCTLHTRTIKYVYGLVTGKFLMRILDSLERGDILETEQYEVSQDIASTIRNRSVRLVENLESTVFTDATFIVDPSIQADMKSDIEKVIILGGGDVVPKGSRKATLYVTTSNSFSYSSTGVQSVLPKWVFDQISLCSQVEAEV